MVKKGEQIALSGNSGGSAGPHLHFEIRETKTANPIDPVSFDFLNIIDNISPIIHRICFFPLDSASFINGRNNPVERKVVSDNDKFVLYNPKPLLIKGDVYFGISTIDKMDNSYNKNGIHSIRCYVDSSLFYEFVADTTSFSQAHCVNAIIDYPKYVNDEERFYKSYKEPNCSSMMLKYVDNDGILKLEDDSIHTVTCLIADVNDNVSTLKFDVRRDTACYEHVSLNKSHYLTYNRSYNLQLGDAKIFIGENALFDDVAVLHNKNQVRITDGGEAMRNYERRTSLHQSIHCFLNQFFGSCFIIFSFSHKHLNSMIQIRAKTRSGLAPTP